jgi:hypothetical protein
MPESSDLSLMTDRVGKGWFSMLCHGSELIGSGITNFFVSQLREKTRGSCNSTVPECHGI